MREPRNRRKVPELDLVAGGETVPGLWTSAVFAAVMLLTVVLGASGTQATPVLDVSTENGAQHIQTRVLGTFVERLTDRLQGHLDVRLHHSAELYRDSDVVDALSAGRVEMAAPGVWHLSRIVPEFAILEMPAVYGREAVYLGRQVDGALGAALNRALERRLDVHVLGRWLDLGHAHIFLRDHDVRGPEDLKGLRLRIAGGLINAWRLQHLGVEPVIIPWPDFPQALRDNLVDGTLTTPATVVSAALWKDGITAAYLDHQYYAYYVPMVSGAVWRRLAPPVRQVIEQVWDETVEEGRLQVQAEQDAALETLRENGVRLIRPPVAVLTETRRMLVSEQADLMGRLGLDPAVAALLDEVRP